MLASWFTPYLMKTFLSGIGLRFWFDQFVVMFSGNMGPAQALECMPQPAKRCLNELFTLFVLVRSGIELPKLKRTSLSRAGRSFYKIHLSLPKIVSNFEMIFTAMAAPSQKR